MASAAALATLTACFGGGGDGGTGSDGGTPPAGGPPPSGGTPTPPPPPAQPPTASLTVRVVDGPILNALVCLDTDRNGRCDTGEPSGRTAVDGRVTLQVPTADANRFPIVAMVGTDAADADSGPVTVPYVMRAPADRPGLVTPLTTLVQQVVESTGSATQAAADTVQASLRLSTSPLQDFTGSTDAGGRQAAIAAQLLVRASQQLQSTADAAVGQTPPGGTAVTAAEARAVVAQTLPSLLADIATGVQQLAGAGCEGGVASTACQAALGTTASRVVGDANVSTASIVAAAGAAQRATPAEPDAPAAGRGNLAFFQVASDGSAWTLRALRSSGAELVPDAQGRTAFREIRQATNASRGVDTWSSGPTFARRTDTHWTGSRWFDCPEDFPSRQTVRDSAGRSTYDYCDGLERGVSQQSAVDIGGRTMLSVVEQIRGLPYRAGSPWAQSYADWGLQPGATPLATLFPATAVFPAGSRLIFQTNLISDTAITYDASTANRVLAYPARIASGGDARANASLPCASPPPNPDEPVTSLEMLIQRGSGTPCQFIPTSFSGAGGVVLSSGQRNDWWSNSTFSLGQVGNAPITGSASAAYYTTNRLLRVSFGAGNRASYWSCQQRALEGSTRNCVAAGSGTYAIATLGDARVLTFTDLPNETAPGAPAGLSFDRVFVERGGAVYAGFRQKPVIGGQSVRLDFTAANALLARINDVFDGRPGWRPLPENLGPDTPAVR